MHFIEGREFHVWTNHKPITFSFANNSNRYLPHQARQLDFISQFTTDIRHVKGSNNPVADALSQVDINYYYSLRTSCLSISKISIMPVDYLTLWGEYCGS